MTTTTTTEPTTTTKSITTTEAVEVQNDQQPAEEVEVTTESTTTTTTTTTTKAATTTTKPAATKPVTTTAVKHVASDEDLCNWSVKDYNGKNESAAATAEITDKSNGQYQITLTNDSGDVLDVYEIDPETGIGHDSNGNEVNLPQTGNNSLANIMIALGALMMTGFGFASVKSSGIFRRKENE